MRSIQISSSPYTGTGLPVLIPRPLAPGPVAGFDSRTPTVADGADVKTLQPVVGNTAFSGAAAPTLERTATSAPYLKFQRANADTLALPMARNTAHTFAVLGRFTSLVTTSLNPIDGAGTAIFTGATAAGTPRIFAGTSLNLASVVMDTAIHVWIVAIDGTNGILRVDNAEVSGPIGNGVAGAAAEHAIAAYNNGGTAERSNFELFSWWRWNRILTADERAAEVINLKGSIRP